jgi:poly(3-hydroxybutyrate) depolymerase/pimeloyl-ACP methyl ester carboxylesterase
MRSWLAILVALGLAVAISAWVAMMPAQSPATPEWTGKYQEPGDYLDTIVVDGTERWFTIHIPPSYRPGIGIPLVVNIHGRTATAFQQEEMSRMNAKADEAGFVAVHPQALDSPPTWWGPIPNQLGQPDMDFFADMLAYLQREISIDPNRIYATGFSNGATMANRLGCDMEDVFAAIAPVSGGHVAFDLCEVARPVPVLVFHGIQDTIIPYRGNQNNPAVHDWVEAWARRDGCATTPAVSYPQPDIIQETWRHCNEGTEVILYSIEKAGHTWPGSQFGAQLGGFTLEIDATDLIWEFFESHPMPSRTSIPPEPTPAPPTAVADAAAYAADTPMPPTETPTKPTATVTSQPYKPLFEPGACEFQVPASYKVECGHLVVPENRDLPEGSQVRLPVAIFKSKSPNPAPDPVIHLVGGPGGNLLDTSAFYLQAGGDQILGTRDYVLFNQRGTHYTEPSLECPGQVEFRLELAGQELSMEEREAKEIEFLLGCQEALLDQGIDLAAYNSAENAADVNDLRIVLGYDQVNLYGISYGTRLALTVMRDYPERIRSVILDSTYPPQVDLEGEVALNADRAFSVLFESCAADTSCDSQYPNLDETFYQAVDELNADPVWVSVRNGTVDVWVDGDILIDAIFGSLYRVDAIPWVPLMISEAGKGNLAAIQVPLEVMIDNSGISQGMYYSLQCREEVTFESYNDALVRTADLSAQVVDHFVSPFVFDLCATWASGRAVTVENEPVSSDIPTLILAGQYDPITPPAWGRLAGETLENSFFYEFPGIGHGVIRSNQCALEIGLQFLDDPAIEPDVSCIDELSGPDFR